MDDDNVKIIGLIYDLKRTLDSLSLDNPDQFKGAALMALNTIFFVAEKTPYWGAKVMAFAETSHGA